VTGNEFFRTITEEIPDYVVREMAYVGAGANDGVQMLCAQHLPSSSSSAGTAGFYSTQDADSEGEEGKFFVWTPDEIRDVLGDDADDFMAAYGVTRHGNAFAGSAQALRRQPPAVWGARISSSSWGTSSSALPWRRPAAGFSKLASSVSIPATTTRH